MIEAARRILGLKRPPAVHVPAGKRPSYYLRQRGGQFFVMMCLGGAEIELTPKEARREANRLFNMAWIASNPGSCPQESHG